MNDWRVRGEPHIMPFGLGFLGLRGMEDINSNALVDLVHDGLKRMSRLLEERFDEEIIEVRRNENHASMLLEMRSGKKFLVIVNKA